MNKKIGIIGDIHGSSGWKKAIEEHPEVQEWIFLGDYVDSFIYNDQVMIQNLRDILAFKLKNKDRVTLLLGNHDLHYLDLDEYYRCSGFRKTIQYTLHELYKKYEYLFDIGIVLDKYLITHAGITESWFRRFKKVMIDIYGIEITTVKLVDWMNDCLHKGPKRVLDVLAQVGKCRGGFEATGGPLWADQQELRKDPLGTWDQIIGHTPQEGGKPIHLKVPTGETLIFCDTGEIAPTTIVILDL